jgi:hypothetical protein
MPTGFTGISVFPSRLPQDAGEWRDFRAFDVALATQAMLQARISDMHTPFSLLASYEGRFGG